MKNIFLDILINEIENYLFDELQKEFEYLLFEYNINKKIEYIDFNIYESKKIINNINDYYIAYSKYCII